MATPPLGADLLDRQPLASDDEMDITPMIDITFLLLIYFLVASTTADQAQVRLPQAKYGINIAQNQEAAQVFTIGPLAGEYAAVYDADGISEPSRLPDNPEQCSAAIQQLVADHRETAGSYVIIKGDKDLPFREADRVIKAVSREKGVEIYLAVEEPR